MVAATRTRCRMPTTTTTEVKGARVGGGAVGGWVCVSVCVYVLCACDSEVVVVPRQSESGDPHPLSEDGREAGAWNACSATAVQRMLSTQFSHFCTPLHSPSVPTPSPTLAAVTVAFKSPSISRAH